LGDAEVRRVEDPLRDAEAEVLELLQNLAKLRGPFDVLDVLDDKRTGSGRGHKTQVVLPERVDFAPIFASLFPETAEPLARRPSNHNVSFGHVLGRKILDVGTERSFSEVGRMRLGGVLIVVDREDDLKPRSGEPKRQASCTAERVHTT